MRLAGEAEKLGRKGLGSKERETEGCLAANTSSRGRKEIQGGSKLNCGLKSF